MLPTVDFQAVASVVGDWTGIPVGRMAANEIDTVLKLPQLLGKLTTPSQAFLRAELQLHIQEALQEMEPLDREVLALRHYEQLSNRETAEILGCSVHVVRHDLRLAQAWLRRELNR